MEGTYSIYSDDRDVGKVAVSREGLYYRFDCQCRLEKMEICKIVAVCGGEQIVLGTPIPEGQIFRLRTKLPVKRFSGEVPRFYILKNKKENLEKFVPVNENEPFLYLKDLKNAVFQVRNGESGIAIKNKASLV